MRQLETQRFRERGAIRVYHTTINQTITSIIQVGTSLIVFLEPLDSDISPYSPANMEVRAM